MENRKKQVHVTNELQYLTNKDMNFFKRILEAETVRNKEYLIKKDIIKKLDILGFTYEVDDIGNISAVRGTASKYPLFNAHMDIVGFSRQSYDTGEYIKHPDYNVVVDIEGDIIYGEGQKRVLGGDDKCGSATRC